MSKEESIADEAKRLGKELKKKVKGLSEEEKQTGPQPVADADQPTPGGASIEDPNPGL